MIFSFLALPFFAYIAYSEYINYKLRREVGYMRFLAGWIFFASSFYFLIEKIPVFEYGLRYEAAVETALLLRAFGINVLQEGIWLSWRDAYAGLILACTAIQSISIFLGAFIAVRAELRRKLYAILAICPVVWFLNLLRNASLIYIVGTTDISMEYAHNYIGKLGSLLALILLAGLAFKILPEFYENIAKLLELPKEIKAR
jgi:archaeosortase A (PGF-CTERM-specific)